MDAWGEQWHPGISRSKDWICDNCNWSWMRANSDTQDQCIVGWNPDPPMPSNTRGAGMVIVECPKCFEKFWFHLEPICLECAEENGTLIHKTASKT